MMKITKQKVKKKKKKGLLGFQAYTQVYTKYTCTMWSDFYL